MVRIISLFICLYSFVAYAVLSLSFINKANGILTVSVCIFSTLLFSILNIPYIKNSIRDSSRIKLSVILCTVFAPLLHVLLIPLYLRDDVIYHLVVPKAILTTGTFLIDPYNINANFPMLFEMPLVAFEYMKQWISPFIVNLLMLMMLAIASFVFIKKHCTVIDRWAVFAIVCVIYTPVLYDQLHSCYVEIFFTLLIVMGFSEYLDFKKNPNNTGAWIRAVIFIGLSCAVKYFGLVYLLFIGAYEFFTGKRRILLYSGILIAVLVCIPWYLKNWICLGNPFYPMLSKIFPSAFLSSVRAEHFTNLANTYDYGRSVIDYLLLPFKIFTGYNQNIKEGMFGFGGAVSIFYILSLFISFKNKPKRIIYILFISYGLIWAFTSQQIRFLYPVLLLSALLGLEKFCETFKRKQIVIWLFFLTALGQSAFLILKSMNDERIIDLLKGKLSKTEFLIYHMPYSYDISKYANKNLNPKNDKILTIGIFGRVYYFDIPTITVTYYDEEPFDRAFYKKNLDIPYIDTFIQKEKVTHILINQLFFFSKERLNAPLYFEAMRKYFEQKTELIYQKGPVVLLKVKTFP